MKIFVFFNNEIVIIRSYPTYYKEINNKNYYMELFHKRKVLKETGLQSKYNL